MIRDLERYNEVQCFSVDVCIIGGGPAGITIAKELIGSGLTACVVESGGINDDNEAVSLYEGFSVGHPIDLTFGRFRVLGGASTRWGGRCAVLDDIDFEHRPWVHNSGWPITSEKLSHYYDRSKITCNFKLPWIAIKRVESVLGIKLPEFENGNLTPYVWRVAAPDLTESFFSKIALGYRALFNFGAAYRSLFANDKHIDVILHSNFVNFQPSNRGTRIESIVVSTMNGRKAIIESKKIHSML